MATSKESSENVPWTIKVHKDSSHPPGAPSDLFPILGDLLELGPSRLVLKAVAICLR